MDNEDDSVAEVSYLVDALCHEARNSKVVFAGSMTRSHVAFMASVAHRGSGDLKWVDL